MFAKIPKVLLEWREHPERLTNQDSLYSVENFLRAKAHYLAKGPALGRDAVFVWGAGMTGRRLSKDLVREELPLTAFVEVDGKKIGNTRRGKPIIRGWGPDGNMGKITEPDPAHRRQGKISHTLDPSLAGSTRTGGDTGLVESCLKLIYLRSPAPSCSEEMD